MATPPTFVAEYEVTDWQVTTTPKTISVTVATGDVLVVIAAAEETNNLVTPTGGGLTYTLKQSVAITQYAGVSIWTATAASSQTFTFSMTISGGQVWGFNVLRFSGSTGVSASNKTNISSGAPSLGLTTTGDNSAIVCINTDWNAADGASRAWRAVNSITPTSGNGLEKTYSRNVSHYTVYGAYWNDAGTAGAKTVGLTTPSMKYAIAAVEVLGVAGSTVDVNAELTNHTVVAGDVVATQTTTDGTAPALAHTTGAPAPAVSAPDVTAPATTHQTFDATVSTAVLVNVAAELTQHTVVAGDPTLSQTTQADVGNHTQITQGPSVGVWGSAGQGQTSHDAQTPSTGLTATDVTAPANTHATATPTVAVAVPAADAANTHQAFDPTVSTAVILNANAESTNHAVVAGDLAAKMDVGAGASTNTHQTFDAVAGISGSAPAGDASNTHTTANTTAGFGPPAQSVSHSLVTSDVTSTQTTTSGAAQNAHSAFDATVSTHLQPPAFVGVDTGLTWSGTVDNAYATRASADSATTPGPAREGAARVALIEGSSAFSGLSD